MDAPEERFYPDGLTDEHIEALLVEAQASWSEPSRATSALQDGSAAQRRERRETRRAIGAVIRAMPHRSTCAVPATEVA